MLANFASDPHVEQLELEHLSMREVEGLLATAGSSEPQALARRVYGLTSGHPLFSLELGRLLMQQGKLDGGELETNREIREVVRRHLNRLSPRSLLAVQKLSLLGDSSRFEELLGLLGAPAERAAEAIEEARAMALLRDSDGADDSLTFSHPLLRDVAYQSTPRVCCVRCCRLRLTCRAAPSSSGTRMRHK